MTVRPIHWTIPAVLLLASAVEAHVGAGHAEATLSFTARVRVHGSQAPGASESRAQIERQLRYLFGSMSAKRAEGVPKNDHSVRVVGTLPATDSRGGFDVEYSYTGTASLAESSPARIDVELPIDPVTIASEEEMANAEDAKHACYDDHDGAEYAWYSWSPSRRGCRLAEGRHYVSVPATIEWKARHAFVPTYPEYSKLVRSREGGPVIPVSILIGNFAQSRRDPLREKNDPGAKQFAEVRAKLLGIGFSESKISKKDMKAIMRAGKRDGEIARGRWISGYPFARLFTKETPAGRMQVRLFFGDSSAHGASAFFVLYKDSVENDSVMIYDGHSGLGENLSLGKIRKNRGIRLVPDRSGYQLFYFNSCTSYAYYNDDYFRWKSGRTDGSKDTKLLDIMTNGLATGYTSKDTNMVIVNAVLAWATGGTRMDYASMTDAIDTGGFTAVNGDEDNSN